MPSFTNRLSLGKETQAAPLTNAFHPADSPLHGNGPNGSSVMVKSLAALQCYSFLGHERVP
jgi:hypothetical protein